MSTDQHFQPLSDDEPLCRWCGRLRRHCVALPCIARKLENHPIPERHRDGADQKLADTPDPNDPVFDPTVDGQ